MDETVKKGEGANGAQTADTQQQDRLKNLQSEMDRKLQNMNTSIEKSNRETQEALKAILAAQAKSAPATPPKSNKKVEDLMFDDPAAYTNVLSEDVAAKVEARVAERMTSMNRKQNEIAQITSQLTVEYPELTDTSSDLYKEAISAYERLDNSLKDKPEGYKLAILEAVSRQGAVPKSKRSKQDPDEFSLGGSGMGNSSEGSRREQKTKISDKTLAFAKLIGRNTEDPKVKERLEKAAGRKTWTQYK